MSLKRLIGFFAAMTFVSISGCASIVGGGSTQSINIDSNPQGAKIFIGEIRKGKVRNLVDSGLRTPTFVTIERKNAVVVLKQDGYADIEVPLATTMNGWFMGNFCIGGLIGSSIDSGTGAINKYDPDRYFVELKTAQ